MAFPYPVRLLLWFAFGLPLASMTAVQAGTLNVPFQYATIQVAIGSSADGDTIVIADGTYSGPGNRDIDFRGKNITVTSQNGPAKTIIDCGGYKSADGSGNHRGFYLHSKERHAFISGLTIKNGYLKPITGIEDSGSGGGICIHGGSVTIQDCNITGNTADTGGGFYDLNEGNEEVTLANCMISKNIAFGSGGIAVSNYDNGTVTLTSCSISANKAAIYGGISSNNFNYKGGNSTITLTNCIITGNAATQYGGVSNFNTNENEGSSTIVLNDCSITGNLASHNGGSVWNDNKGSGTVTMINCILYGNTGGEVENWPGRTRATANYCDVQDGYEGVGNIDADPMFINGVKGDLHLTPNSPCLGKGIAIPSVTTDKDGKTRGNPPSIGAYEGNAPLAAASTLPK